MHRLLLLLLLVQTTSYADFKTSMSAMVNDHFSYATGTLNSGKGIFLLKKKIGMQKDKALFQKKDQLILTKKLDEFISIEHWFHCQTRDKKTAYGLIQIKEAKKRKNIVPIKAWKIDFQKEKLVIIDHLHVTCEWRELGDSGFPFF